MERRGFLGLFGQVAAGAAIVPFVGKAAELKVTKNGGLSLAEPQLITPFTLTENDEFLVIPAHSIISWEVHSYNNHIDVSDFTGRRFIPGMPRLECRMHFETTFDQMRDFQNKVWTKCGELHGKRNRT